MENMPAEEKIEDTDSIGAQLTPQEIPVEVSPTPLTPAGRKKASYGALISIIIIMAIVIVGAFYSWHRRAAQLTPTPQAAVDETAQ